ncbi:MAG: 4Fe-4S binding protein [Desulfobulbus sp.]|jgi:iron only hydrogenase large subunit-like protein|uniref:[Fe-Fe] hydrogenase large subunit C-terminal domain-containing protein n=1 Tax=Desulfobulbus sp. TaxID=895 RepID=UPI00283E932C|nr:[Fe-Fe] hydrogenase large subunit C-terminal domain-containing protein [Desulfobulbus sp.]MDR2551314.1 4Fe-4S binding protein [Desulfobulbus sp.]
MDKRMPIYTEKHECQDCYKCVRHCPVKAIRVQDAYATIVPEMCVFCGGCVSICPNAAKHVRNDLARARQLVKLPPRVYVSLAPSWLTEFPDIAAGQMVAALRRLGVTGVSETALGAQQVSAHVARSLAEQPGQVLISSACPTVVAFIQKHRSHLAGAITGLLSPLLAHCRLLRHHFGAEIATVFIGPCIAKKVEADEQPELLDVVLTFEDLRLWLAAERIDPETLVPGEEDRFVPTAAEEGVLYPVDGGMIAGIQAHCRIDDAAFMSFSGLGAVANALDGLSGLHTEQGLFLELLACEGGCINGPKVTRAGNTVVKRHRVLRSAHFPEAQPVPRRPEFEIVRRIEPLPLSQPDLSETRITEVLRSIGKRSPEDELNCGGCGYDSCREFGKALIARRAERAMCVSWMRQLAFKKANVLMHKMPSAVVIVDSDLRVLECNEAFVAIINHHHATATPAELEGVSLEALLPFHSLFASVLKNDMDILDRDVRFLDTILHLSIFTIDPHAVAGAILQDITRPAVQKEQVIRRAREVIQKNLATVQKIAYLLGENAAESEVTLNSIIESFSPAKIDGEEGGGSNG